MFPDLELDIRELKHIRFWDAHGSRKLKVLIPDAHYTFLSAKFGLKCKNDDLIADTLLSKCARINFILLLVAVRVSKSRPLKFSNNILRLIGTHIQS